MAEPKYNETPTRADYNRSAEFKVDKKDDFWKMALPFALGILLGWAGAEMADNASQQSSNYRGDGFHGTAPGGTGMYTTPGSTMESKPGTNSGLDNPGRASGGSSSSATDGNNGGSGTAGSPTSPGSESSNNGSGVGAPGSR